MPPAPRPTSDPSKESQTVDDNLKDANRMIAELDSAPSLRPAAPKPSKSTPGVLPTSTTTSSSSPDPLLSVQMSAQMSTQMSGPVSSIHSDLSNTGGASPHLHDCQYFKASYIIEIHNVLGASSDRFLRLLRM